MTKFPFTFGVSRFTTQPWTFDDDLERYARLGVDTIEVVEAKLDDVRYAEQMESIVATGLAIGGVQPAVRTFFASRRRPEASRRRSVPNHYFDRRSLSTICYPD